MPGAGGGERTRVISGESKDGDDLDGAVTTAGAGEVLPSHRRRSRNNPLKTQADMQLCITD